MSLFICRGEAIENYRDQTDVFYESPIAYLRDRFPRQVNTHFPPSPRPYTVPGESRRDDPHGWLHEWPQYITMFGALLYEPNVATLLKDLGYEIVWEEDCGWEGDERRRAGVVVWEFK